jgi:hypothetical protein
MSFDHHGTDILPPVIGGVLFSTIRAIMEYGLHAIEIALYGVVGGFFGMCGQWVWKNYVAPRLPKKNKDA